MAVRKNDNGGSDLFIGASNVKIVDEDRITFIINGIEIHFGVEAGYLIKEKDGVFYPFDPDSNDHVVFNGRVEGYLQTDDAGATAVSGDFNGDGEEDLVIGAPLANTSKHLDAGRLFVLLVPEKELPAEVDLSELKSEWGFIIEGRKDDAMLGTALANAGDFDGDGQDDILVGAPGENAVYLIKGREKFPAVLGVDELNGANGYHIEGKEGQTLGNSVHGGEDLNGDGKDDLIIYSQSGRETHVVYGFDRSDAVIKIAELDGINGLTIHNDEPVTEVALLGDLDGNGKGDLGVTGRSASYVIYQPSNGFSKEIYLENSSLEYVQKFEGGGSMVSGDFNNDGYNDLAIGFPDDSTDEKLWRGAVKVLFGGPQGLTDDIENLKANEGFTVLGHRRSGRLGYELTSGYVDDDEIIDIIASVESDDNSPGQIVVIKGQPNPIIDLNGSDAGIDDTVDFTGDSPVIVDENLIVTSPNPIKYNTLSGARVTITHLLEVGSEIVTTDTSDTNIEAVYDSSTGILTLNGTDTIANYQKVLRSITYNNTDPNPDSSDRTIEYVVDDGPFGSAIAKTTLVMKTPNILGGTASDDILNGTSGNDNIHGRAGDDLISGGDGDDTLTGGEGNDTLNGEAGNDLLRGEEGDDVLDGGIGSDTMIGGLGNDTYIVNSLTDSLTEVANAGTDTVQSLITFTLGDHLENLTLTGTDDIDGTGNELDNVITGNSGNNTLTGDEGNDTLDGGTGNDTLRGGDGDDIYYVDSSDDLVEEDANSGIDTVFASQSFKLESYYIENLTLIGTADINGTGNGDNNLIIGNDGNNYLYGRDSSDTLIGGRGNDTLVGGEKNDTLTGGIGSDSFYFWKPREAGYNSIFDTITDFSAAEGDIIQINAYNYGISDISEVSFDAITQSIFIDENKVVTLEWVTSFNVSQNVVLI